jgi:gamma-glutamylaminecyclotransferase
MTLVFVYGTLKRGFSNHHYLAGQAFVGNARTAPGYAMYDLAGYPGMVRQGDDPEGVSGEVWSVDDECLARLDVLECTAEGLYRREAVPLGSPFEGHAVEAYVYLKSTKECRRLGAEWLQ